LLILDFIKKTELQVKSLEDYIIEEQKFAEEKEYKKIKMKYSLTKEKKLYVDRFPHFYGILGFIKLLQGYYLIVITQMSTIAKLGRKLTFISIFFIDDIIFKRRT